MVIKRESPINRCQWVASLCSGRSKWITENTVMQLYEYKSPDCTSLLVCSVECDLVCLVCCVLMDPAHAAADIQYTACEHHLDQIQILHLQAA